MPLLPTFYFLSIKIFIKIISIVWCTPLHFSPRFINSATFTLGLYILLSLYILYLSNADYYMTPLYFSLVIRTFSYIQSHNENVIFMQYSK